MEAFCFGSSNGPRIFVEATSGTSLFSGLVTYLLSLEIDLRAGSTAPSSKGESAAAAAQCLDVPMHKHVRTGTASACAALLFWLSLEGLASISNFKAQVQHVDKPTIQTPPYVDAQPLPLH